MRRRRVKFLLFVITLLCALIPSVLFLGVSYQTLKHSLFEQMQSNAAAAVERSEAILYSVQKSLDAVANQTKGACDAKSRRAMTQAVFNNINVREMGIVSDARLVCNDEKLFVPPVNITNPSHLVVPKAGEIHITGVTATLDGQSILVHRRINDTQFVNALVYPEVFGDALAYFRMGQASGVYLLDEQKKALVALGKADVAELPNRKSSASGVISRDGVFYAIARSKVFPISAVLTATRPWFFERWWRDAALSLVLGLLTGALLLWLLRRYMPDDNPLDDELQDAFEARELQVFYQPIVALNENNRVVGHEALLRWVRRNGQIVLPNEFIARAERSGFVTTLTDFVLREALKDRRRLGSGYVSVNLSALDLQNKGFADRVAEIYGGNLSQLMLEITETELLVDNEGIVRQNLERLIAAGARVALDDFGSGYCGMNYLRQFPIQLLKMDQSFTRSVGTDAVGAVLAERIIEVGKSINLDVIAEGIESEEIAQKVRALGVKYGQGWLYGRAEPIAKQVENY
jgi:sensor c-di-GMP phosphodiesterase-like protein